MTQQKLSAFGTKCGNVHVPVRKLYINISGLVAYHWESHTVRTKQGM